MHSSWKICQHKFLSREKSKIRYFCEDKVLTTSQSFNLIRAFTEHFREPKNQIGPSRRFLRIIKSVVSTEELKKLNPPRQSSSESSFDAKGCERVGGLCETEVRYFKGTPRGVNADHAAPYANNCSIFKILPCQ